LFRLHPQKHCSSNMIGTNKDNAVYILFLVFNEIGMLCFYLVFNEIGMLCFYLVSVEDQVVDTEAEPKELNISTDEQAKTLEEPKISNGEQVESRSEIVHYIIRFVL